MGLYKVKAGVVAGRKKGETVELDDRVGARRVASGHVEKVESKPKQDKSGDAGKGA